MNGFRSKLSIFLSSRAAILLFSAFWLFGILLGTIFAVNADNTYYSMMRGAAANSVSIVGLVSVIIFPFLFAAFAAAISSNRLLYFICFMKAFLFSACAVSLIGSFGSASWLVGFLLQFSDCLTLPVFGWFSIRCAEQRGRRHRDLAIALLWCAAVGCADYFVISPFLAGLIGN